MTKEELKALCDQIAAAYKRMHEADEIHDNTCMHSVWEQSLHDRGNAWDEAEAKLSLLHKAIYGVEVPEIFNADERETVFNTYILPIIKGTSSLSINY